MARTTYADSAAGLVTSRPQRALPVRALFRVLGFAKSKPLGFLGAVIVLFFIFTAVFAPWVAPYDYKEVNLRARLQGSSAEYWLGTDQLGRDVLSRLIQGARLSMVVGFGAVIASSVLATAIGLASAYFGGWFDTAAQRIVDAMIAMPDLIILITLLGIAKRMENVNLIFGMVVALAFVRTWPATRVVRSVVFEIRARPYIEAAEAVGATPLRSMLRHVLPNIFPLVLVTATIALPNFILAEATLSFLGFGPAGEASWGQMLSADGRENFRRQLGLAVYPGLAIGLVVFGFNMFGDALRDVLDPRLRGSR
jgi:peptide/nickel transport system permease protein